MTISDTADEGPQQMANHNRDHLIHVWVGVSDRAAWVLVQTPFEELCDCGVVRNRSTIRGDGVCAARTNVLPNPQVDLG